MPIVIVSDASKVKNSSFSVVANKKQHSKCNKVSSLGRVKELASYVDVVC